MADLETIFNEVEELKRVLLPLIPEFPKMPQMVSILQQQANSRVDFNVTYAHMELVVSHLVDECYLPEELYAPGQRLRLLRPYKE